MEKKNDLEYIELAWTLLTRIEKIAYIRNERFRSFCNRIRSIRAIFAGIMSASVGLAIFLYFLSSKISLLFFETSSSPAFLITIMVLMGGGLFIFPYMMIQLIWEHPIFLSFTKIFEKKSLSKLHDEVEKIDRSSRRVIAHHVFQKPRIPIEYLNYSYLARMQYCLKQGRADSLGEAVEYLKEGPAPAEIYFSPGSYKNLVEKEFSHLADSKQSIMDRIEISI